VDSIAVKPKAARADRLNPVETEVIDFFVQFSRALGQPRSVAEVYGLLFVSPVPLTLNDVEDRLEMSRGSAFQGLQFLEELGAVRAVRIPDQRRMHYEAVAQLRNLAGSFLRQQVLSHLSDSPARLQRITKKAELLTGDQREFALARAKLLKSWDANGRRILPFLLKILGGK